MNSKIAPNKPMHYAAWIAPNGDLYSCPDGGHYALASAITKIIMKERTGDPEDYLVANRWIKISREGVLYVDCYENGITQSQIDTLFDLANCEHHEEPPDVILNSPFSGDKYIHGTAEGWKRNIMSTLHFIKLVPLS